MERKPTDADRWGSKMTTLVLLKVNYELTSLAGACKGHVVASQGLLLWWTTG